MEISPLRLERHYFRRILLEAAGTRPTGSSANNVQCKLRFAIDGENRRRFKVDLDVAMSADPEAAPAYSGVIEVTGLFSVADNWPENQLQSLVTANGPSLLYDAVREMVLGLTCRMEQGPLQLPTVRFPPRSKEG